MFARSLNAQFDSFRILALMRMLLIGSIELELAEHLDGKLVFGQHAADRFVKDHFRMLRETLGGGLASQTGIPGGPGIAFAIPFISGENDFVDVGDNDVISAVDVRGVGGLVFAHKDHGDIAGETADHFIGGVDNIPFSLDFAGLGHERFVR